MLLMRMSARTVSPLSCPAGSVGARQALRRVKKNISRRPGHAAVERGQGAVKVARLRDKNKGL